MDEYAGPFLVEDRWDEHGSTEVGVFSTFESVAINKLEYRALQPPTYQNIATFQGKFVQGDYTDEADELLSNWVAGDVTGGSGIEDLNEGSDMNRCEHSTIYTRYPKKLTKPYAAYDVTRQASWPANGNPRCVGELYYTTAPAQWVTVWDIGGSIYASINPTVAKGVGISQPTDKGVLFRGYDNTELERLFWPTGDGYCRLSEIGGLQYQAGNDVTFPKALSMCTLGNNLYAIDIWGRLWKTPRVSSGWTILADTAHLPSLSYGPTHIRNFFDRGGDEAIFVLTDSTVFQLVEELPELVPIKGFNYPRHPYSAFAVEKWNDDLYVSVGMSVFKHNSGSTLGVGLDRDSGLPLNRQGYIVEMVSTHNSLFALVNFRPIDGGPDEGYCSLQEYNNLGWHEVWAGLNMTGIRSSLNLSQGDNQYRIYWGVTDGVTSYLKYMNLPSTFANPRANAIRGKKFAGGTYEFVSGWYDAQMAGQTKIAADMVIKFAYEEYTDAKISVYFKLDYEDAEWEALGSGVSGADLIFGFKQAGREWRTGRPFRKMKYWVVVEDPTETSFVIESIAITLLKVVRPRPSWTMRLDMSESYGGRDPETMALELESILSEHEFVLFEYMGHAHTCFLSSVQGTNNGGADARGYRDISIVKILEPTSGAPA